MRLSGLVARLGPSPFTTAPCSVTRSGMRHSPCTPMSRLAAFTISERSVVSRVVELSKDSRANGTRNCPTVAPHPPCVAFTHRSVAERLSGGAGRAHLDLRAIRRQRGNVPLKGEARSPQEEHRRITVHLEARLEIARQ